MARETSEEAPLRPTGNMERFNIIRNHLSFYNNIQVSANYTLPRSFISTHGLHSIIHSALAETLKAQPILGVTIQDEGHPEPKWRRLLSINLPDVIEVKEGNESKSQDDWITEGHRARLDRVDELPLWRIKIAISPSSSEGPDYTFKLAFYSHHAIADGLSAGAFHTDFLSAINKFLTNPSLITTQTIIPVPKIPLIDTLETRNPFPVSIWYATKKIFTAFVYAPSSPLTWTGPLITSTPPKAPPASNLLTFSVCDEDVQKLVSKCREQKTTLTCLVSVLVARRLGVMYGPRYKRFIGNIPFSLRKWTNHTPLDMGCYVSNVSPKFSSEAKTPAGHISCLSSDMKIVEEEDERMLWVAARECKRFIDEETKSEKNQSVGMLAFVSDIKGYFLGRLGTKREHTFEVTNIGVLDGGGKEGKASFDNAVFSTALCTYGDPYCISMATVKGGCMTVGLNWVTNVTGDEEARGMAGWLEKRLNEIAERFVSGKDVYLEIPGEKSRANWSLRVWLGTGLVIVAIITAKML